MQLEARRIGIGSALLAIACAAAIATSVAATANDAPIDSGPMADRVIEAKNRGIPADVVRRFETVRAALANGASDPWAAEYREGDGLGENVTIALDPATGVAATWFGCLGLYGANEGDVIAADENTFAFRFNRPNDDAHRFGTFPATVRKVRWGERRYLIDTRRYVDFVNAINGGFEPPAVPLSMGNHFLLADGDQRKPVVGLPDIPAEWLAQIRTKPLLVRVTSVDVPTERGSGDLRNCIYRLHFEVPPGETVPVGLDFRSTDEDVWDVVTVTGVEGREATAKVDMYEACDAVKRPPTTDWVLTSGGYIPQERVASR
jgi:hypothetical protein